MALQVLGKKAGHVSFCEPCVCDQLRVKQIHVISHNQKSTLCLFFSAKCTNTHTDTHSHKHTHAYTVMPVKLSHRKGQETGQGAPTASVDQEQAHRFPPTHTHFLAHAHAYISMSFGRLGHCRPHKSSVWAPGQDTLALVETFP